MSGPGDLSSFSLADLFRSETETQAAVLSEGLLALERNPRATERLEELMRAAHSLKGAASIVGREVAVRLTHAMEDCFVRVQREGGTVLPARIDALLQGVDLLRRLAQVPDEDIPAWDAAHQAEIDLLTEVFSTPQVSGSLPLEEVVPTTPREDPMPATIEAPRGADASRSLRVTAENLNRLLGLAGESVIAASWLDNFTAELQHLKRQQADAARSAQHIPEIAAAVFSDERTTGALQEFETKLAISQQLLSAQLEALNTFTARFSSISSRLYQSVLDCRMRPFSDGVQGFPRLVRDAARSLKKEVRLEIIGDQTPVDREILERVESPLSHLLRNAVDHAMELPEERIRNAKPAEGMIRLEARHSAGMLLIDVVDDGRGIDPEALREAVVRKGLTVSDTAAKLTDTELLEFLFLPGFSMKGEVTEMSGRGVGLDVVQTMVREAGGSVRVSSQLGVGTQFQLQLPLTLSVLRTLLVAISGEVYALPLSRITSAVVVARESIAATEGHEHFQFRGEQVGLVTAHQILGLESSTGRDLLPVVVIGEKTSHHGLVVDRFIGERELVVLPLDPRLGKIKDVSAAALMPDQTPVLILDVDDLKRSIENLVHSDRLAQATGAQAGEDVRLSRRVLVVDDSLTVRELERKLLESRGYTVEVAVDGMDGWNAARTGSYDLVITDVDMPRLDGIELLTLIKKDPRLGALPVMIVSYKDREEDRQRGLDAGADYYLTKSSFHDERLLNAVQDLIGAATA